MGIGNIANSGMKASMSNMEVISNNIANVNTSGFKKSYANFSDLYASGGSSNQPGLGVNLSSINQDFSQGDIESTALGSNMSIKNGSSFFVLKDALSGQTTYSRAGEFVIDDNGYFVMNNRRLQGFPASNNVILAPTVADLQIPDNTSPASASSTAADIINLDAGAAIPTNAFSDTDPTSYNFRTNTTIYDSLGVPSTLSMFYIKTAQNTWTVKGEVGGTSVGGVTGMTFSPSGAITSPTTPFALSYSPTSGATSPQTIDFNPSQITQYGGASKTVAPSTQNGYASGTVGGYSVDNNGVVTVQYTNGQTDTVGQVALANFQTPQALAYQGNMSWTATSNSGAALITLANSSGNIASSTLEMSNVDLTDEMVSLIDAQHSFQANAQVEKTYNEIMQTVIQL